MTTPIKTQCPHCHTISNIKKNQLNQKAATVYCKHCQRMFLINKNLIVTADTDTSAQLTDNEGSKSHDHNQHDQKTAITTANKNHSTQSTESEDDGDMLIHDDMIHDDMDISDDESAEYDSLDSMDAWLNQAADSDTLGDTPLKKTIQASESSSDLLRASSAPALSSNHAPSSAQVALSSAAANNLHASIDNTTDESWLERLLKEQNQDEDAPSQNPNTDLSQILMNMGVDFKEDDNNKEARARRQEHVESLPTFSRRSVATLLWICGCLVLIMLLFAQYIIFNLNHLVKNPNHAERLQTICSLVACSLPSADLKTLSMSDISYQSSRVHPKSGFSDISAAINNQSSQAQLYPHMKVSVYGSDALIGEFIAAPDQYLVAKQSQLAANSRKQLLFTVPVTHTQITKIVISPIY